MPVLPDPKVLATTQDRLAEKDFVAGLGIGTAPYAAVGTAAELVGRARPHRPARGAQDAALRLRRQGPGTIGNGADPRRRWQRASADSPAILEAFVPFAREVRWSPRAAADGAVECFDVTENEHATTS